MPPNTGTQSTVHLVVGYTPDEPHTFIAAYTDKAAAESKAASLSLLQYEKPPRPHFDLTGQASAAFTEWSNRFGNPDACDSLSFIVVELPLNPVTP